MAGAIDGNVPQDLRESILNLSTNDDVLITKVSEFLSKSTDPNTRIAIEKMLDTRSRAETTLSNMIRLIGETARNVINNIRA